MPADGNPNQALYDAAVRHRIAIERYTTRDLREVQKFLDELRADILARLANATPGRRADLERLLDDVRAIHGEVYRKIQDSLSTRFRDRAGQAAEFHAEKFRAAGLEGSISRLTADAAFQAAMARPMDGAILSEWLQGMEPGARQRMNKALTISWTEGESLDRAVKRVRAVIDVNKRSAQTLVRTANTHISNAVQQASAEANSDIVREVEWRSVLDGRTTWICRSRDGQRFPINEGPRPPAHPGCLPGDALVSTGTRVTGAFKRWYDGQVVVIRTATGKEFTSTPNHPVLTSAGWLAAAQVNVGTHVVCDAGIDRVPAFVGSDDQNVEARIEDATEAFFGSEQMCSVPVPTTAKDFHGDGIDNEVAIVAINRVLRPDLIAALGDFFAEPDFVRRPMGLPGLTSDGGSDERVMTVGNASLGSVGLHGIRFSGSRLKALHSGGLLSRSVADLVTSGLQLAGNDRCRDAVLLGNAGGSDASFVQLDEVINRQPLEIQGVHNRDASALKSGFHSGVADAELAAHLLDGAEGPVALDKVVSVRTEVFAGHVFNLETEGGWYVANGIVTHNCRSIVVEVLKDYAPPQRETYADWIKRQPAGVQDEILGPTRGKLLRSGKYSVGDFVDTRGQPLTLDELKSFRKRAARIGG